MTKRPKDEEVKPDREGTSSERVLKVLDLFTEEQPVWTTDNLINKLGLARATVYRYIRALLEAGFLTPLGGSNYGLGPRFIEIDRRIRMTDPLLRVAPPVMAELREVAGTQLLCRFYELQVLSIYEDKTDMRIKSPFDRGRSLSLFVGSPSRIILAYLPVANLQRLFLDHAKEITTAGLGANWSEFRDNMRDVRDKGYVVASDLDKTLVGVSTPIFLPKKTVTASLCLVRLSAEVDASTIDELAKTATRASATISKRLQKLIQSAEIKSAKPPRGRSRPA
jgi:DNA-binding IclR family transcriptional regulator